MKKITFISILFLIVIMLVSCTAKEGEGMLHYRHDDSFDYPYIGDVHPFYNEKTDEWYMYYLDTSGGFNSKLLKSKDAISWVETPIYIKSSLANYGVLGIVESDGYYYSYYGNNWASRSTDLINWEFAGLEYQVPQDLEQFPGGSRDPYVAYDDVSDSYYSIAINYTKRIPDQVYQSNLAISKTDGNDLTKWSSDHKKVFAEDEFSHDPEVPMLMKIGNRWYIFYSVYGYTVHGVGQLRYLIGDENKTPLEVDWQTKETNYLLTEDLAAAQVVKGPDNRLFAFGWVPKNYNGNFWGGDINLATEIYQVADGTLRSKFHAETIDLIKGKNFVTEDSFKLGALDSFEVKNQARSYYNFKIDGAIDQFKVSIDNKNFEIIINGTNKGSEIVIKSGISSSIKIPTSRLEIRQEDFNNINMLEILFEGDIVEVSFNDKYVLHSRVAMKFGNDNLLFTSTTSLHVKELKGYSLKFRSEI